jgi:hypothetical protein
VSSRAGCSTNAASTSNAFGVSGIGWPSPRRRIRLSADGESFRTSDTAELTDLNGTVARSGVRDQGGHPAATTHAPVNDV